MAEKNTADVLTAYVFVKKSKSVAQRAERSSETVDVGVTPSRGGPWIPELAISTLMYPTWEVMVSTALWRSILEVTSPWRGMMFPCF